MNWEKLIYPIPILISSFPFMIFAITCLVPKVYFPGDCLLSTTSNPDLFIISTNMLSTLSPFTDLYRLVIFIPDRSFLSLAVSGVKEDKDFYSSDTFWDNYLSNSRWRRSTYAVISSILLSSLSLCVSSFAF